MPSRLDPISLGLQRLEEAKHSYLAGDARSADAVLNAAQAILEAGGRSYPKRSVAAGDNKEKPSDFLQRVMWAQVCIRHRIPCEVESWSHD